MTNNPEPSEAAAYRAPIGAANGKIAAEPLRRRWPWAARLLAAVFALLAVLVCVVGLVAARLAVGPVSLEWMVPLVQSALSKRETAVRVQLQDATLSWRDWEDGPTLSLGDVRAVAADGTFDAEIDALSASLSTRSLLQGQPVPRRLSASGIRATVVLPTEPGNSDGGERIPSLDTVVDSGPLKFIDAISVNDMSLALATSPGVVSWRGRIERMAILRGATGLEGDATLSLDQNGTPGSATLAVRCDTATSTTSASLVFDDLHLAALAPLAGALAPLSIIDIPLSGNAAASLAADGTLQTVSLSATGENGRIALSPHLAERFGVAAAAQEVPLRSLAVQVTGLPGEQQWAVEALQVTLPETATVTLPAPIGKVIPLRQITGRATYSDGRLSLPALDIALDRPRFTVTADIADLATAPKGSARVTIRDATIGDVRAYWPPQMAANAYTWVNEHLVAGRIGEAEMQMSLGAADGETTVTALQMSIPVEGAVVDYLSPLPAVRNGRVVVGLDLKTLTVTIEQATVDGLAVSGGRVVIPDYNADVPTIDIDFTTRGGIVELVRLLATKPLEFVPTDLIHPDNFGGLFEARVRLGFPLLDDLDVEQIEATVAATTDGASFALPQEGVALSDGNLRFSVTTSGLHAAGSLKLNGVRGLVEWSENFAPVTPLRRSIDFRVANAKVAVVRKSVDPTFDLDRYLLDGQFDGVLRYTERDDGNAWIDSKVELTEAAVAVPELRWRKPIGQASTAQAQISMTGGRLDAIRGFRLSGGDADVHGSALFTETGKLQSVYLDPFVLGRSHLKATIISQDGKGWDITLTGQSLDAAPFLQDAGKAGPAKEAKEAKDTGPDPNLLISVDLEKAWINGDAPLQGILVSAMRTDHAWQFVQVRGETDAGAQFSVEMEPLESDHSSIAISAEDTGATLSALGLSSNLRGGRLTGQGTGTLSPDSIQLSGELRVDRFHLVGAPLVARMLDVLAVTGLRDALTGRGIAFSSLRIPFEIDDGVIGVRSARASGASLGMTGSGTIDLDNDAIEMSGTVIPFYWANSALGRLPIIGGWLTGGEAGGGVFSATYRVSGSLAEPRLDVNPYSIVLPSVIRSILEWIQSWIGPQGNNQVTTPTASP